MLPAADADTADNSLNTSLPKPRGSVHKALTSLRVLNVGLPTGFTAVWDLSNAIRTFTNSLSVPFRLYMPQPERNHFKTNPFYPW